MEAYVTFAHELVDISGKIIWEYFRRPFDTDIKPDQTPVTQADHEAETTMRQMIEEQYPEHGIIGEEGDSIREDADYCWVLDPIDGTKNFMTGQPTFGTLVALTYQGKPIIGLMNQPITNERWVGIAGEKTIFNGQPIKTRPCPSLEQATMSTTSPYHFDEPSMKAFEILREKTAHQTYGSDCYAYAMLAQGYLDIVAEGDLKAHDIMALIPIIEGAGGSITDWHGKPLQMHQITNAVATGDPSLHEQTIRILQDIEIS